MGSNQPGIYWDPHEPIPDLVLQQLELENEVAWVQHHEPGHQPVHVHHHPEEEHVQPPADAGFLPPIAATVKAQLIQDTAKVSITQLFANESSRPILNASYTFPLPQDCTVVDFVCRVGRETILRGKVKPKKEAYAIFDSAVRRNETAGLLHQNTTEIFTTMLGNVPANTRLKVEVSYIALLKYNFEDGFGLTTFTLPTYIAPRFGTPPRALQQALGATVGLRSLAVEVDILAAETITSVTSPSHPSVTVEIGVSGRTSQTWREFVETGQRRNPTTAVVQLPETVTKLDRDFVLEIRNSPEASLEIPKACLEAHPDLENHKAVMLTIPPEFLLKSRNPGENNDCGEIIFVADRSGSMRDKIDALKSAMVFFLKGIPENKHFNIACFGTNFEFLWPCSQPYSQQSLQAALDYVSQSFYSDMGGTMLLPALKAAVATIGPHSTTDIVVLTDGQVWDLQSTLNFVERARNSNGGRYRFFSLGIGAAVSHALVEGIAKLGGGYAEVIPLASRGGWESRVVAVLTACLTGHIGPISIELQLPEAPDGASDQQVAPDLIYVDPSLKMLQSPADISKLSPFVRNRVFMMFEDLPPTTVLNGLTLKATRPDGQDVDIWVPIKALGLPDVTVHKLAARALLGDLERGQSQLHTQPRTHPRSTLLLNQVKNEGERLGCKWSLVSKWTSFYAIEELFQPTEAERDPFMDAEDTEIEVMAGADLDLFRPRGAGGGSANLIEAAEDFGESEEDEDTTDSSVEDNKQDDESDDDDEQGGPPADPGASGGDNHGGNNNDKDDAFSHNEEPSSGHSGESGTDRATMARGEVASDMDAHQGHAQDGSPTEAMGIQKDFTKGSCTAWNPSMAPSAPRVIVRPLTGYNQPPEPRLAAIPPRDLQLGAFTGLARPSTGLGDREPRSYGAFRACKSSASLRDSPSEMDYGDNSDADDVFTFSYPTDVYSLDASISSNPYQQPALSATETPQERPNPHPPVYYKHVSSPDRFRKSRTETATKTHQDDIKDSTWAKDDSEKEKGSRRYAARGSTGAKYDSKTSYGPDKDRKPKASWLDESLRSRPMAVPSNNAPASTAMLDAQDLQAVSAEDAQQDAVIQRLLGYQDFDGSFMMLKREIITCLGERFCLVVEELEVELDDLPMPEKWVIPRSQYRVALAAAIIAMLENQFLSRRALWQQMVSKSMDFIQAEGICGPEQCVAMARSLLLKRRVEIKWQASKISTTSTDAVDPPLHRPVDLASFGLDISASSSDAADPTANSSRCGNKMERIQSSEDELGFRGFRGFGRTADKAAGSPKTIRGPSLAAQGTPAKPTAPGAAAPAPSADYKPPRADYEPPSFWEFVLPADKAAGSPQTMSGLSSAAHRAPTKHTEPGAAAPTPSAITTPASGEFERPAKATVASMSSVGSPLEARSVSEETGSAQRLSRKVSLELAPIDD